MHAFVRSFFHSSPRHSLRIFRPSKLSKHASLSFVKLITENYPGNIPFTDLNSVPLSLSLSLYASLSLPADRSSFIVRMSQTNTNSHLLSLTLHYYCYFLTFTYAHQPLLQFGGSFVHEINFILCSIEFVYFLINLLVQSNLVKLNTIAFPGL